MVANIKIDELDLTDDRARELQAEIRHLRGELQAVTEELTSLKAQGWIPGGVDGITIEAEEQNIYVFEEEDKTGMAFDEFFAAPDPHLEKVRGFLLD